MKAFPTRNYMTTSSFIQQIMNSCSNKPVFLVDGAPWYKETFNRLGLPYLHVTFGKRNPVERLFGYLKHRTKIFYNNININFRRALKKMDNGLKDRIGLENCNFLLLIFEFWYTNMR